MKKTLSISLVLNVVLFGGIVFFCFHIQKPPATLASSVAVRSEPLPLTALPEEVEPFRWSQLISSNDFRSFVSNLRAAGCPEATVEDIVRGDAGRAYSVMRARMGVSPDQPGSWSVQSQIRMIAYFLGQASAPMPETDTPPLPLLEATPPLVLQNVDLSTLALNDAQTQAIAGIRETFLNTVGGTNQDASDPDYLARWQKAQHEADDVLQGMLGEQAFAQYEVKAYQMSLLNQETPARN